MDTLLLAAALPFAGAAILGLLGRWLALRSAWVAVGTSALLVGLFSAWLPAIQRGEVRRAAAAWAPALGVNLDLRLDGLSLAFALLVTGAGALIALYGRYYLGRQERHARFYAQFLLFQGAMLGMVLSANLIALFVFWELTSVTSFLLIGFWHQREAARAGAMRALLVTGLGGIAMLLGFILLFFAAGTWEVEPLLAAGDTIRAHPWYPAILLLIFAGVATKSAQVPFHIWLPSAMEAPTPVSAYLHSATMVQAGLYLAARMFPVLGGTELWTGLLTGFGLLSLVAGGFLALRQDDLKALLAYSTVSQLGFVLALFGLNTRAGVVAGAFHLLTHAVFKAALFLTAGIVEHETHTRRLTELGGLLRALPLTGAAAILAGAASAGLPPFGTFASKEAAFEAAAHGPVAWLVAGLLVLGSALTVAYSVRFVWGVFLGKPVHATGGVHEGGVGLWGPAGLLAAASLAFGLFAGPAGSWLIAPMASAIAQEPLDLPLSLWHGFGMPLALSGAAVALGLAAYARRHALAGWRLPIPGASVAYDRGLVRLDRLAASASGWLQGGDLRRYLAAAVAAVTLAALWPVLAGQGVPMPLHSRPLLPYEGTVLLLIAGSAVAAAVVPTRFAAVLLLGVVGYLVGVLFIILNAPDLALTQILIETVSVALFLLVLYRLPRYVPETSSGRRLLRDLGLSLGAGAAVFTILAATMGRSATETIAGYFLEESLPAAGGRNVVNVILIDFRGYDTLGEISVLAIGLVGVYALVAAGRRV